MYPQCCLNHIFPLPSYPGVKNKYVVHINTKICAYMFCVHINTKTYNIAMYMYIYTHTICIYICEKYQHVDVEGSHLCWSQYHSIVASNLTPPPWHIRFHEVNFCTSESEKRKGAPKIKHLGKFYRVWGFLFFIYIYIYMNNIYIP